MRIRRERSIGEFSFKFRWAPFSLVVDGELEYSEEVIVCER